MDEFLLLENHRKPLDFFADWKLHFYLKIVLRNCRISTAFLEKCDCLWCRQKNISMNDTYLYFFYLPTIPGTSCVEKKSCETGPCSLSLARMWKSQICDNKSEPSVNRCLWILLLNPQGMFVWILHRHNLNAGLIGLKREKCSFQVKQRFIFVLLVQ